MTALISTIAKLLHIKGSSLPGRTVVGWVDGLRLGQVRGWAMDMAQPPARLTIEVVRATGEPVIRVLADRYRADIQKAGYGDGHHGFAVAFPSLETVSTLRFVCVQSRMELKGFPAVPSDHDPRMFEQAGLLLRLDHHRAGAWVSGWALNKDHPCERRHLRLRAGRRLLAEQKATLFRPDSMQQSGDGFHGFCLPLPANTGKLFIDDVASGSEFRIS